MTDQPKAPGLLRTWRRALLRPALARIAKAYVAGDTIEQARAVAAKWAGRGIASTLGYWDDEHDTPRGVADQYLAALRDLRPTEYLSIKLTALDYSEALFSELAECAATRGLRLHFDAMMPESAARTRQVVEGFVARWAKRFPIGYTLPGRWGRSVEDAAWTAELGLPVRVVKGQFPDDSAADPRAGFVRVIRALAGRAAHVGVATHDVRLGEESLELLKEKGTSRELELLYGLPVRDSLESAQRLGEKVRVYVGYGKAHLPYAVSKVLENPRMLLWFARDFLHL